MTLKVFFGNTPPPAGGGPITGTGALSSAAATVAGTAERTITGTGTLSAQAASASGTGTVGGVSITLTDFEERRVFQRVASTGQASITISGTYTGTPAGVAARVVQHGTSTEVVTWTTIDSSLAGGTFSGSLTVPQGGWYNVQVRLTDATSVTDNGTARWGVGMLVLCIGQSNMARWFDSGTAGTPDDLLSVHAGADESAAIDGTWAQPGATARTAVTFGNDLITTYSIPVGLLDYAVGSTTADAWNTDNAAHFCYQDAERGIRNCGGELEYILWALGESDAALSTPQATYEAQMYDDASSVIKLFRANATNRSKQTNLPWLMSVLGRINPTTASDADTAAIRAAQLSLIGRVADCYYGAHCADLDNVDSVHYTDAQRDVMAQRLARTIKYLLGDVSYHRGPYVSSAGIVDSTTIDVGITHRGGTDFTPTSGINGFEVLDAGTPVALSSVVRQNATTIRITLSSATSGAVTVRYLYGADGGVTYANTFSNEVVDNATFSLPLEGEASVSATINATGSLSSQAATIAGTAERTLTASGTLNAGGASVSGTASVVGPITGVGALQCGVATINGVAIRTVTGTGALSSSDASIVGFDQQAQTTQRAGGKSKGKRVRPRIIRDEQFTPEERRRLGIPEPQEAAQEAEQAPPQPKRARRTGKASRGIQLAPEPTTAEQFRAAEILAQRTAELMAQQQAATEAMRAEGMAMLQAAAAIEADNELMMLLLMAA